MSSPPNHTPPPRIDVLEDVLVVLDSPSASFRELMDCAAVARSSGDLRLARLAAEQAFGQLVARDDLEADTVRRAARTVVRSYVAQADSELSLPRQVRRAKAWLNSQRSVLDLVVGPEYLDDEMTLLSEVQALLTTSDPDGWERLSVRLEELDLPDPESGLVRSAEATSTAQERTSPGSVWRDERR